MTMAAEPDVALLTIDAYMLTDEDGFYYWVEDEIGHDQELPLSLHIVKHYRKVKEAPHYVETIGVLFPLTQRAPTRAQIDRQIPRELKRHVHACRIIPERKHRLHTTQLFSMSVELWAYSEMHGAHNNAW